MIKAIDLRIGNWVEIPGEGFTQILNGSDIDKVTIKGAEPIHLNAELLMALGFTRRGETAIFDIKINDFAYHAGSRRVLIIHPGNQFWHWLGSHIDSVHQIQNLFYCLIGFDLTLNKQHLSQSNESGLLNES